MMFYIRITDFKYDFKQEDKGKTIQFDCITTGIKNYYIFSPMSTYFNLFLSC